MIPCVFGEITFGANRLRIPGMNASLDCCCIRSFHSSDACGSGGVRCGVTSAVLIASGLALHATHGSMPELPHAKVSPWKLQRSAALRCTLAEAKCQPLALGGSRFRAFSLVAPFASIA